MKNKMKKLISLLLAILMMASLSVTAFAAEPTQSLANFNDDTMSDAMDFNYTVTHETTYTELSAVKLEWSVPVLKYTKTDARTWNTTKLEWEQAYKETTDGADVTFTLTNRGSYAVKANVSFTPVTADSASVSFGEGENDTNNPTIDSIVGDAHALWVTQGAMDDEAYKTAKETYLTNYCKAVITGKVTMDTSKLTADSGKLGTYTVKIERLVNIMLNEQLARNYYSLSNNKLVFSGATWEEIIAANEGNTVTLSMMYYDDEYFLSYDEYDSVKYLCLKSETDPQKWFLATKDYSDEESDTCPIIQLSDPVTATVYIVRGEVVVISD